MLSNPHALRVARFDRCVSLAFFAVAFALLTQSASATPIVPAGFSIRTIVTVENAEFLQDIAPGQDGAFGTDLYYLVYPNQIWRVNPSGGTPSLFTIIGDAVDGRVMSFGFNGDLFLTESGMAIPGRIYEVRSDGTFSLFGGTPTASEGIAYSSGGVFGNRLFVSEFDNCQAIPGMGIGNPISAVDASGTVTKFTAIANGCARLTGLAFAPAGGFGGDLFAINTNNGIIYQVGPDASYSEFLVDRPVGPAETLAFGHPTSAFGDNLFVAKDFSGELYRIGPDGQSELFASGFAGFDFRGVTGLKFSDDGETLYVTDDTAGTIYAITAVSVPEPSTALLMAAGLSMLVVLRKKR